MDAAERRPALTQRLLKLEGARAALGLDFSKSEELRWVQFGENHVPVPMPLNDKHTSVYIRSSSGVYLRGNAR